MSQVTPGGGGGGSGGTGPGSGKHGNGNPNPSNKPNGVKNGPGWYIIDTLSANGLSAGTLAPAYAKSVANFKQRYGSDPMFTTPYKTQAEAKQAIADNFEPHGSALAKAFHVSQKLTSGSSTIGDFLSRLDQASTWVRVAKVVAGGALLLIAAAHMTGADNAAFQLARRAPVPV